MKSRNLFFLILLLPLALSLPSCIVIGVGATVATVDIVHGRRTAGVYIDDGAIELKVREFFVREPELRKNAHLSVTSMNGIVLLSGEAPTVELRNKVEAHAKSVQSVRQVVNEIRVAGKTALVSRANDTCVKVISEYGNVYLMGLVSRAEAARATDVVRGVGGVVRVVKVFEYTD